MDPDEVRDKTRRGADEHDRADGLFLRPLKQETPICSKSSNKGPLWRAYVTVTVPTAVGLSNDRMSAFLSFIRYLISKERHLDFVM